MFKPNYFDTPISIDLNVQASNAWYASVGDDIMRYAQDVLNQNSGTIHSVINGQVQLSRGMSVWVKTYSSPAFDIQFIKNNNQTHVRVVVRPENSNPSGSPMDVEINLDGYIFWMQTYFPSYNLPNFTGTIQYEFLLNGKSLYTYNGPLQSNVGILFKFGITALKCQSLIDKTKDNPNEPGNPNAPLVSPILPPRNKIATFQNAIVSNPNTINAHADLPGYFIYDAKNPLVIAGYTYYPDDVFTLGHETMNGVNPIIYKTIVVDSQLDVLKDRDLNKFRVKLTPTPTFSDTWTMGYDLRAEFYDRQEMRAVTQSWTRSGGVIQVNDKPRFFRMGTGAFPTQALDIDLTPVKVDTTTPTPQTNPVAAYDADDDILTQWSALACRGYWRPGDPPAQQPQPPNDPWSIAFACAQLALEDWGNLCYALYLYYSNGPTPDVVAFTTLDLTKYTSLQGYGFDRVTYWEYESPINGVPDLKNQISYYDDEALIAPNYGTSTPNYDSNGNYIGYTYTISFSTVPYQQLAKLYKAAITGWDDAFDDYTYAASQYASVDEYLADQNTISVVDKAQASLNNATQYFNTMKNGGPFTSQELEYFVGLDSHGNPLPPRYITPPNTQPQLSPVTGQWGWIGNLELNLSGQDPGKLLPLVKENGNGVSNKDDVYAQNPPGNQIGYALPQTIPPTETSYFGTWQTPLAICDVHTKNIQTIQQSMVQLQNLLQAMDNYITP